MILEKLNTEGFEGGCNQMIKLENYEVVGWEHAIRDEFDAT